jgi:hypothetical protein
VQLPVSRFDVAWLTLLFAGLVSAAGAPLEDAAAGALAVAVGGWLIIRGRPPFGSMRVPPAWMSVAWASVALAAVVVAAAGPRWGFAMLAVVAALSAGSLVQRRREARGRNLI